MPITLILLIVVLAGAVAAVVYSLLGSRERRAVLGRASGRSDDVLIALKPAQAGLGSRTADWVRSRLPSSLAPTEDVASTLVHAGYDGASAPAMYAIIRIATAVGLPLMALAIAPRRNFLLFVASVALAVIIGLLLPSAFIANRAGARQQKLRRSLPDAMDLLVVCVEAGISLDAAILRVAREMAALHPDLANEFLIVNRRVNAGMSREQALHGLWLRTGLEDLRGLASNMIQSEKWGTSIATVLRVYAETLRRKRKQAAEKKAATAPLKMMIPLAVFIFPTIFVVLMGPAIIKITAMFREISNR
ncbi:MAG TPA: type II secretion system F family protein [Gemmatimonadaceae bacterium]|nr:type II secretion system F family protein [Gemmatimonadaceae bacterium]